MLLIGSQRVSRLLRPTLRLSGEHLRSTSYTQIAGCAWCAQRMAQVVEGEGWGGGGGTAICDISAPSHVPTQSAAYKGSCKSTPPFDCGIALGMVTTASIASWRGGVWDPFAGRRFTCPRERTDTNRAHRRIYRPPPERSNSPDAPCRTNYT